MVGQRQSVIGIVMISAHGLDRLLDVIREPFRLHE